MYSLSDLRKGLLIELNGEPCKIIDAQRKSLGRGGAVLNAKLKNLATGAVFSETFKGNDKLPAADVQQVDMQFLYRDGGNLIFMNTVNYEQIAIELKELADEAPYLKEGQVVIIQFFDDKPMGVILPPKVELVVAKTAAGVKGNTAKAALKDATLETGLRVQVPLFISEGDSVRIDTRSGEYVERAEAV